MVHFSEVKFFPSYFSHIFSTHWNIYFHRLVLCTANVLKTILGKVKEVGTEEPRMTLENPSDQMNVGLKVLTISPLWGWFF